MKDSLVVKIVVILVLIGGAYLAERYVHSVTHKDFKAKVEANIPKYMGDPCLSKVGVVVKAAVDAEEEIKKEHPIMCAIEKYHLSYIVALLLGIAFFPMTKRSETTGKLQ